MRTLYVHRKKYFFGCLSRYFIYLVDEKKGDCTKDGLPCRLVGTLQNGKTCQVEIPEYGCMIFIASSRTITSAGCKAVHFPMGSADEHIYVKAPAGRKLVFEPTVSRNEDLSDAL